MAVTGAVSCILVLLTVGAVRADLEDKKKMEEYKVVPDIIPVAPPARVTVKYGDLIVDMGNELTPTQVHDKPSITWDAQEGAYYTLLMTDHDIPPQIGAKEVQHWLVVNIPGNDVSKGETLFDYVGSGPPEGSGLHRYVFLAYKQPKKLEKAQYADIQDVRVESRRSHIMADILKKFGLTNPDAGNFYRAQYDENVPKYHAERRKKYEKND